MPVPPVAVAIAGLLGEDGRDAFGDLINPGQFGVGEEFGREGGRERLGVAFGLEVGGDGFGGGFLGLRFGGTAGGEGQGGQEEERETHSLAVARNGGYTEKT